MLTDLLLGATPVAGGALLGLLAGNAGNSRAPDFRAAIKADQEILSKLPPEDSELRAALKNSIDARIRDLIALTVLAALYAGRGIARGLAERRHRPGAGAGPS